MKTAYRRATTPQMLAEHLTQEAKSASTSRATSISLGRTSNLDRGALRVSTTLWSPFEELVLVNDLNAAEVRDLAQALEVPYENLCRSDHLGQRVARALDNGIRSVQLI